MEKPSAFKRFDKKSMNFTKNANLTSGIDMYKANFS